MPSGGRCSALLCSADPQPLPGLGHEASEPTSRGSISNPHLGIESGITRQHHAEHVRRHVPELTSAASAHPADAVTDPTVKATNTRTPRACPFTFSRGGPRRSRGRRPRSPLPITDSRRRTVSMTTNARGRRGAQPRRQIDEHEMQGEHGHGGQVQESSGVGPTGHLRRTREGTVLWRAWDLDARRQERT